MLSQFTPTLLGTELTKDTEFRLKDQDTGTTGHGCTPVLHAKGHGSAILAKNLKCPS